MVQLEPQCLKLHEGEILSKVYDWNPYSIHNPASCSHCTSPYSQTYPSWSPKGPHSHSMIKQTPSFPNTLPTLLPANVCSCCFLHFKCLLLLTTYHLRSSSPPQQKQYLSMSFDKNFISHCLIIQLSVYVLFSTRLRTWSEMSFLDFSNISTQ